jgi:hypothetical protein
MLRTRLDFVAFMRCVHSQRNLNCLYPEDVQGTKLLIMELKEDKAVHDRSNSYVWAYRM